MDRHIAAAAAAAAAAAVRTSNRRTAAAAAAAGTENSGSAAAAAAADNNTRYCRLRLRARHSLQYEALGTACSIVCFIMVLVIFLAAVSCFLRELPKLRSLRGAVVSEP